MRRRRDPQPPSRRAGWSAGRRRGGPRVPPDRAAREVEAPEESDPFPQRYPDQRYPDQRYPDHDPWPGVPTDRYERVPPRHRVPHPRASEPPEPPEPTEPAELSGPARHDPPPPRKLTVTRVAAWRGRQLTSRGIWAFQRAAAADGADRSGLTALTYATMFNYANDAAIAVALANTLFFAAATAESKTRVALYLLITVAPFAVVAPVIGPLLDRLRRGRRLALAGSFLGRAALAVVLAFHFDDWGLYPAALGVMVLSKSFTVLRAAVTPRVLPETITLVTTNSRLTTFGLVAGGVFGAVAAGLAKLTGSPGALFYTAALGLFGAWLCARIPAWVEDTEGEVPATVSIRASVRPRAKTRQPMGRRVVVSLWANAAIRVLTGFLMLFVAFLVKAQTGQEPVRQVILLGIVGAAAGIGGFLGNGVGARQRFERSDALVFGCVGACVAAALAVVALPGIAAAAVCALVASTASALAKVCLDAVIQRDLPERSRASAFGRSETVLQLAWVFGGALGVLLPPVYRIGFGSVAAAVVLLGAQAVLVSRGRSLLPWIGHRRQPVLAQVPEA